MFWIIPDTAGLCYLISLRKNGGNTGENLALSVTRIFHSSFCKEVEGSPWARPPDLRLRAWTPRGPQTREGRFPQMADAIPELLISLTWQQWEGASLPFCGTAGTGSVLSRHRLGECSSDILAELVLPSFVPDIKQFKTGR